MAGLTSSAEACAGDPEDSADASLGSEMGFATSSFTFEESEEAFGHE